MKNYLNYSEARETGELNVGVNDNKKRKQLVIWLATRSFISTSNHMLLENDTLSNDFQENLKFLKVESVIFCLLTFLKSVFSVSTALLSVYYSIFPFNIEINFSKTCIIPSRFSNIN